MVAKKALNRLAAVVILSFFKPPSPQSEIHITRTIGVKIDMNANGAPTIAPAKYRHAAFGETSCNQRRVSSSVSSSRRIAIDRRCNNFSLVLLAEKPSPNREMAGENDALS